MKAGWSEDGGQAEGCSQHTEFAKLSTDQSGEETGHFEIFSAVQNAASRFKYGGNLYACLCVSCKNIRTNIKPLANTNKYSCNYIKAQKQSRNYFLPCRFALSVTLSLVPFYSTVTLIKGLYSV